MRVAQSLCWGRRGGDMGCWTIAVPLWPHRRRWDSSAQASCPHQVDGCGARPGGSHGCRSERAGSWGASRTDGAQGSILESACREVAADGPAPCWAQPTLPGAALHKGRLSPGPRSPTPTHPTCFPRGLCSPLRVSAGDPTQLGYEPPSPQRERVQALVPTSQERLVLAASRGSQALPHLRVSGDASLRNRILTPRFWKSFFRWKISNIHRNTV